MDQTNASAGDRQSAALAPELQRNLQAASQEHHLSLGALHEAVCAYLHELRMAGMPRKDAFDAVRVFVAQARDHDAAGSQMPEVRDRFFAQIAAWCEEHWRASP